MLTHLRTQRQAREGGERGRVVAGALAGAWRSSPPPLPLSLPALDSLVPCLIETGAASLGWWRCRQSGLEETGSGRLLRDRYRHSVLEAALHEDNLQRVVALLRAAGVEPLLVKGWSVARLYSEPALRPYCDLDLCVEPIQLSAALNVLATPAWYGTIDLHQGVADLDGRTWQDVYQRSRLVPLGDMDVRILGAEDQLRHLCLHLLRHGARRPLWLCDVGAALESRPADFDWDYCLGGDARLTEWVLCVLGLAQRLLGARVEPAAVAEKAAAVPSWLVNTVLTLWGSDYAGAIPRMATHLAWPRQLVHALHCRWQNPIEVLFSWRARPYQRLPVLLIQLAAFVGRGWQWFGRVPQTLFQQAEPLDVPFDLHPVEMVQE